MLELLIPKITEDGSSQAKRPRSSAPDHIYDMTNAFPVLFIPQSFHSNYFFTTAKVQIISIPAKYFPDY